MRADHVLAQAWNRSRTVQTQPEGFLEDSLGAALEATDAWSRLAAHFRWSVPTGPFTVSSQDRVDEGRSDLRLRFADGNQVVLELKAGPAPSDAQLHQYVETGTQIIGLARTPRRYAHPALVGTTTWADLVAMPWPDPPLPWRQFVHLAHALGVAMPPVDVSALMGLQASFDAQSTVFDWAREGSDLVAKRLSGGGVRWVVKQGSRGRRFIERQYRRQVAWVWPVPWKDHPYAGVLVGLYMGHPSLPVLVQGLPDLRMCWHAKPGEALHTALGADPAMLAAAVKWTGRPRAATLRTWDSAGWVQVSARCSSAVLLDSPEPGNAFLDWVTSVLDEWDADGISAAMRPHLLAAAGKEGEVDEGGGPPVAGDEDTTAGSETAQ